MKVKNIRQEVENIWHRKAGKEKHITKLNIQPTGTGIQPIVDARANIDEIVRIGRTDDQTIRTEGTNSKLAALKSTRLDRGVWKVETDIEEVAQTAGLKVEYTYVIRDDSDPDYLSQELVDAFRNKHDTYSAELNRYAKTARKALKTSDPVETDVRNSSNKGETLGAYYYTQTIAEADKDKLAVPSRVETIKDLIYNELKFEENERTPEYSGDDFRAIRDGDGNAISKVMTYYNDGGEELEDGKELTPIITNTEPSDIIIKTTDPADEDRYDYNKTVTLTKTLSIMEIKKENGISIPLYIGEISEYTNAAGRRDMEAVPDNLKYVHSEDTNMTVDSFSYEEDSDGKIHFKEYTRGEDGRIDYEESYQGLSDDEIATVIPLNELDEFWGERILITKPTGEDKAFPTQLVIVISSSVVVLGIGLILIKKYALKK